MLIGYGLSFELDRKRLTGEFRVLLRSMYDNPTAQICTPGHLSSYIPLTKGTQQGCPLSPLLFDIAIEPLEDSDLFHGIQLHNEVVKLVMFADDVILFLSDSVSHLSTKIRKSLQLPFLISKLMPLWGHPEFPQGVDSRMDKMLRQKGILTAGHLINPDMGKWYTVNQILDKYSIPATHFLAIAQLLHFCKSRLVHLA